MTRNELIEMINNLTEEEFAVVDMIIKMASQQTSKNFNVTLLELIGKSDTK